MRRISLVPLLFGLLALGLQGCDSKPNAKPGPVTATTAPLTIKLSSSAFADGQPLPATYGCDGRNISPPLSWTGVPKGATELVLVMEDRDAKPTFLHWAVLGLDASREQLDEGSVPAGGRQINNSAGHANYTGPCPPKGAGPHHYDFLLFALSKPESVTTGGDLAALRGALKGKTLAEGKLVGTYQR
jgi:Raf kinase inhibitor-like YbhB/YbcL family protein